MNDMISFQTDSGEYEALAAQYCPFETPVPPVLPAAAVTDCSSESRSEAQPWIDSVLPISTPPPSVSRSTDGTGNTNPEITIPESTQSTVQSRQHANNPEQEDRHTPVALPERTNAPASSVELSACVAQNKDFIAWITIPGTRIDYPVVRSDDTEYYLHHLFSGRESKLGCLFSLTSADYRTPGKNIAIYGHHLSNSTAMFSTLMKYKSASYRNAHSQIRLDSLYGSRMYRIFAVVNMSVADWDASTASFPDNRSFLRFVERAREQALYETNVPVKAEDHILTLITCDRSYGGVTGRLIVMAVQEN